MRGLVACPFCREMFPRREARTCPSCGLALQRLEDLPASPLHEDRDLDDPPLHADEERLPLTYVGRHRGALVATSVAGLVAFFLPWVHERAPELRVLRGPDLARELGWMWAPFVAWLVMLALVVSRRSVFQMRGARFAVGFLAALSVITAGVRLAFPPRGSVLDPFRYTWGTGVFVTGALGVLAIALAWGFGGRLDVLATQKPLRKGDETLH